MTRWAAPFVVFGLLIVVAPSASATAPGRNGDLAFWTLIDYCDGRIDPTCAAPTADVSLVSSFGGEARNVTRCEGRERICNSSRPAWSPDGRRLAWSQRGEIVLARADGTRPRVIAEGSEPCFSPDGREIAFTTGKDEDLVRMSLRTRRQRLVVKHGWACEWSIRGRIVYADRSTSIIDPTLRTIRADGADAREIAVVNGAYADASWSPRGDRLVFATRAGLFVSDGLGGPAQRLATEPGTSPAWSPDGRRIAYAGSVAFSTTVIRIVRTDMSVVRTIPIPGPPIGIAWQPLPPRRR